MQNSSSITVALFMAVKNVLHRKGLLLMIMAIIGLGYLSTMFSSSVILGLRQTIEDKVIYGLMGHIVIEPEEDKDYLVDVAEIEKKIISIPDVVSVSPRINFYVTIYDSQGSKVTVPSRAIDPDKEFYTTLLASNMLDGKYLSEASENEILLGAEFTKRYRMVKASDAVDVDAGDVVQATVQYGGTTRDIPMKIRGVYGQGFMFTDQFSFMSKNGISELFDIDEEDMDIASLISVKVKDRESVDKVIQRMKSQGIDGVIWSWEEKLGMLDQFIDSLMVISQITALIGVIIAFATIYIMIFINVLQKRSQIGILKAIGINQKTILISYIIQSFIYGLFGTGFGIIFTKLVLGYIHMHPIDMPMGLVRPVTSVTGYVLSSLLLLVSAIIAGYMASRGVIKEEILEAIFKG